MLRMRVVLLLLALVLSATACADPARFRPAKNVSARASVPASYRVHEVSDACEPIGVVVDGATIEDVAVTAARHGGTHYRVTSDDSSTSLETTGFGVHDSHSSYSQSTTRALEHHRYAARVYVCYED